jgi:hypothetical protein
MHVQRQDSKYVISLVPVNEWLKDTMQSKNRIVSLKDEFRPIGPFLLMYWQSVSPAIFVTTFGAFKVLPVMAQAEEDYRMLRAFSS